MILVTTNHPNLRAGCHNHIISMQCVAMDPNKVSAMESWPLPRTLHTVHEFLGLTRYYRKFIANYGEVV
jgi:hypothetical protein